MKVTVQDLHTPVLEDIMLLCRTFVEERKSKTYTFDLGVSTNLIFTYVNDPCSEIFLEYIGSEIAGGIIIHRIRNYCKEWVGIVSNLYVMPDCRGTGISRQLMQHSIDWFEENKCVFSKMNSGGELNEKPLENLIYKFGYSPDSKSYLRKMK